MKYQFLVKISQFFSFLSLMVGQSSYVVAFDFGYLRVFQLFPRLWSSIWSNDDFLFHWSVDHYQFSFQPTLKHYWYSLMPSVLMAFSIWSHTGSTTTSTGSKFFDHTRTCQTKFLHRRQKSIWNVLFQIFLIFKFLFQIFVNFQLCNHIFMFLSTFSKILNVQQVQLFNQSNNQIKDDRNGPYFVHQQHKHGENFER